VLSVARVRGSLAMVPVAKRCDLCLLVGAPTAGARARTHAVRADAPVVAPPKECRGSARHRAAVVGATMMVATDRSHGVPRRRARRPFHRLRGDRDGEQAERERSPATRSSTRTNPRSGRGDWVLRAPSLTAMPTAGGLSASSSDTGYF